MNAVLKMFGWKDSKLSKLRRTIVRLDIQAESLGTGSGMEMRRIGSLSPSQVVKGKEK